MHSFSFFSFPPPSGLRSLLQSVFQYTGRLLPSRKKKSKSFFNPGIPVQPVKGEDTVGPSLLVLFDSSGPMKTDEPIGFTRYRINVDPE